MPEPKPKREDDTTLRPGSEQRLDFAKQDLADAAIADADNDPFAAMKADVERQRDASSDTDPDEVDDPAYRAMLKSAREQNLFRGDQPRNRFQPGPVVDPTRRGHPRTGQRSGLPGRLRAA